MFISQNFFLYLVFGCISSQLLGRLCILPATFLSGFFSAACAILIERPRRRAMLAGYMLNLTTDILYRMLRSRGVVRDIQHGEVVLFALSLGAYIYYARKHGYFEDPVTFVIRHLFGAEELHGTERQRKTKHASLLVNGGCQDNGIEDGKDPSCNEASPVNGTARVNGSGIVDGFETRSSKETSHAKRIVHVNAKRDVNANEKSFTNEHLPTSSSQRCLAVRVLTSRHLSCQHPFGCLAQFCRNMAKFASLGWAVGFGISLLGDLKRLPGRRRPFLAHVLGSSSLRSACFLGGLTGIYKLLSCSLRWASNGQRDWHGLVAGSAAGLAAVAAPNSNASLYLLWKLIELAYLKSADEKLGSEVQQRSGVFFYSLCTGIMLYAAILEPHNLRPQYLKFLDDILRKLGYPK
uniref:Putative conserved plasma membrane protein n=2 Tax=Ixodes ricinus TaxID=34613 RepID=V5HGI7_IXORI